MRLFTAIDPPDALRERLTSIQDDRALSARWTSPEQFHVTLRYIGEVDAERASRYATALDSVRADSVECEPYGLDVLPSRRSPRVLTLGLERTESVVALYLAVSDALESEGLEPEDRTFRPHVTIARLNDVEQERVHEFLRSRDDESFPSFRVDRFVLYESTLTPQGAIHDPYAAYPLSN